MLAQEIIRRKRDGQTLEPADIQSFVEGLVDGRWSDAQAAAMAMAIFLRGMEAHETIGLTQAMTRSGSIMEWAQANLPGPILDKHSTGGVGDKVSLMLAPIVAACGGYVPMISGRGLGHTGGTLDKFDCIPGYQSLPSPELLTQTLRSAGCAVIGATNALAPADKRLYAIRDVTATVESIPLITASILSKKLAAGLQGLVLDVKTGNGAFAASTDMARALANSLVDVANGAGLKTLAWLTDMNQVLGDTCGNALEMVEAVEFLQGKRQEPRLLKVTRVLCAELLCLGGLCAHQGEALKRVDHALHSGLALEHFAKMVAALGGPSDFVDSKGRHLTSAPVQLTVPAPADAWLVGMDTRAIGLTIIELGGGRRASADTIDPRVGFSDCRAPGQRLQAGEPVAVVHASTLDAAQRARQSYLQALQWGESAPLAQPVLIERIGA